MRRIVLCSLTVLAVLPAGAGAAQAVTGRPMMRVGHTNSYSTNWSGYAAYKSGTTFSDVKGSWVEPTATCSTNKATYASFWVGIDGYNSNSVEQLGTDADCTGTNKPKHYAWFEMYPDASHQISGFAVHPGDGISAEVSRSNSSYTLSIKNNTTGATFSTTQSQSGLANSSAEWVAEAPALCRATCQIQKLTNFGTVNFSGSYSTGNGHTGSISDSNWSNDRITMVTNGGTVKASPSALSTDGTSFSVTWKHG